MKTTIIKWKCERYGACPCPVGTHAWKAFPPENNHMIPHDPISAHRADDFCRQLRADTKQSYRNRKAHPDTGRKLTKEEMEHFYPGEED